MSNFINFESLICVESAGPLKMSLNVNAGSWKLLELQREETFKTKSACSLKISETMLRSLCRNVNLNDPNGYQTHDPWF